MASSRFPTLYHGKPHWPTRDDQHLFWVGVRSTFQFAHHPACQEGRTATVPSTPIRDYFCRPSNLVQKLVGVLRDSDRGSILVTGYRGTGKTSLVGACKKILEDDLQKQIPRRGLWWLPVNLATVSSAHEVLLLTYEAVCRYIKLWQRQRIEEWENRHRQRVQKERENANQKLAKAEAFDRLSAQVKQRLQAELEKMFGSGFRQCSAEEHLKRLEEGADYVPEESWDARLRDAIHQRILLELSYQNQEATFSSVTTILHESKEYRTFESVLNALNQTALQLRSKQFSVSASAPKGLPSILEPPVGAGQRLPSMLEPPATTLVPGAESQLTFEREALSHAQATLAYALQRITNTPSEDPGRKEECPRVVFVFDELDKLQPSINAKLGSQPEVPNPSLGKLAQLQAIVAELKHFLTEADSHQIFIAGKDVDDSWSEDQNKGEGLFESIFACNIYVPSIFSTELDPCTAVDLSVEKEKGERKAETEEELTFEKKKGGRKAETEERSTFYELLARELGIPRFSWAFNTSLLILPHLAEYEIYHLVLRAYRRRLDSTASTTELATIRRWVGDCRSDLELGQPHLTQPNHSGEDRPYFAPLADHPGPSLAENPEEWLANTKALIEADKQNERALAPVMSERTCRRLRILLEYLTYKGRGIPRKILREFYDMVQPASVVTDREDPGYGKIYDQGTRQLRVKYVVAFEQHHLQKMNFYAGIVEYLDLSFVELRGLNDKGRVSIYHIIDYVLKFYSTGFSQRDIEHANFMTTREEFYPTRQLAALILRILEGRLWRRKASRSPEFRMLHHVVHDLSVMFLRYAPEQMELRHTNADFRTEFQHLENILSGVDRTPPEQRLAPVHAQLRLARLLDHTGNHFEARLAYFKALRWLRMDIHHFEREARQSELVEGFVGPFAGYAIDALLAVGRLHEEMSEHRNAILLYAEAKEIHRKLTGMRSEWSDRHREEPHATALEAQRADELLETLVASKTKGYDDYLHRLTLFLSERDMVQPIDVSSQADKFAEVCNHNAVAFAKMWETTSANLALLDGLLHLHEIHDEHGVIDQCFFIGQFMVRRRDFHAAALWYVEALRRIRELRNYSNTPALQSGVKWQTPPMLTSTEALIVAALGDIYYATGGVAFLDAATIRPTMRRNAQGVVQANAEIVRTRVTAEMRDIIKELDLATYEDREEEHFHTCARTRFQSIGDHLNATEVHLRQLEIRLGQFQRAMTNLDGWTEGSAASMDLRELKYVVLNSWSGFWQGARVLLHANLSSVGQLTRDARHEWGRVTDFRRMGVLLRLVGEMFREVALHSAGGNSRMLLTAQSVENNKVTGHYRERGDDPDPHYLWFTGLYRDPSTPTPEARRALYVDEMVQQAGKEMDDLGLSGAQVPSLQQLAEAGTDLQARERLCRDALERRGSVNQAARDIRLIFSFVSDRPKLADLRHKRDHPATRPDLSDCGPRSLLYRLSGSKSSTGETTQPALPIAHVLGLAENATIKERGEQGLDAFCLDFRTLALAEKALLTAYLCHRDTIADYNYAQTTLALGDLYLSALYLLGVNFQDDQSSPFDRNKLPTVLHKLMEYAKRYIAKTVDVLKREREQNRNTFHLLAEAYFNLGDLMLMRLAAMHLHAPTSEVAESLLADCKLFGSTYLPSQTDPSYRDDTPEDLRRQISEAYRQGLVLVQTEMDEHASRFRFPGDVFYSNRNVMDAVLHFRICRAARMRLAGGRYGSPKWLPAFDFTAFRRDWQAIMIRLANFESPQRFSFYWEDTMRRLLITVNRVRTDRGPLTIKTETKLNTNERPVGKLTWLARDKLHLHESLDFFHHVAAKLGPEPVAPDRQLVPEPHNPFF